MLATILFSVGRSRVGDILLRACVLLAVVLIVAVIILRVGVHSCI
jgi:hypothetical protein